METAMEGCGGYTECTFAFPLSYYVHICLQPPYKNLPPFARVPSILSQYDIGNE